MLGTRSDWNVDFDLRLEIDVLVSTTFGFCRDIADQ